MNLDFADLLLEVIERNASDLHLTAGAHPTVRVRGRLTPLEDYPVMTTEMTREIVYSILSNDQRQRLETDWQIDFAYSIPGRARFRVNAYYQRSAIGAAFRLIPVVDQVARGARAAGGAARAWRKKPRGFVLVTGPTGSGKSTTLAAMIDQINATREEHIMTIEDPIEFLHGHKKCLVNQREIGSDAQSFATGLKAALRQDPDVILVGEMRDLETIHTALTAAETGHLVFATLHTQDTPQTIDRIIDVFPASQQQQVRVQLSVALQGVVTQQLLPTADGAGRVAACEILLATPAIRNLIREGKTHQIYSSLQTGGNIGMQTMDAALATLVRSGKITQKIAESRSSTPEELRRLLGASSFAIVMSTYVFKAIDVLGQQAKGEVDAESKQSVADQLKAKGLIVLDIAEKGRASKDIELPFLNRIKLGDLAILTRQLATMVSSGMTILRALYVLEAQTENKKLADRARRRAQGRRGGPAAVRRARAPSEDLQPAVRRDDARGGDRRRARGLAAADRRPAREGGVAAPPGQVGDGLPDRHLRLRGRRHARHGRLHRPRVRGRLRGARRRRAAEDDAVHDGASRTS